MQDATFMGKYPIHTLTVTKAGGRYSTTETLIAALQKKVEANPNAVFIALFDHFSHTASLPDGDVAEGILAAQQIIFCFGIKLPGPEVMAVRPRSISVTEYEDHFVISFMSAPNPAMNDTMKNWVESLV